MKRWNVPNTIVMSTSIKIIQPYNEYAEAYKEIASRAEEAHTVLNEPGRLGSYLGHNIWHAVLDELILLRQELARVKYMRDAFHQQLVKAQQELHAVDTLKTNEASGVVIWPTTAAVNANGLYNGTSNQTPVTFVPLNTKGYSSI